jgi:hypothetical protein
MTQTPHPAVAARRRRIHTIRVRVAAGAVALFLALFSGLYVQMAGGHDPALAKSPTAQATSSSPSSDTSSGTTSSDSSSADQSPMVTQAS